MVTSIVKPGPEVPTSFGAMAELREAAARAPAAAIEARARTLRMLLLSGGLPTQYGAACTTDYLTVRTPFIPAAAWPGTVQRYGNLPFFANLTTRLAFLPGLSSGDLMPAILKSCDSLPAFVTLKMTVPSATDLVERTKLNSFAFTKTMVLCARAPASGTRASPSAATASAASSVRIRSIRKLLFEEGCKARLLRAVYLTVKTPFIPAAACPGTVQRYGYLAATGKLTRKVADFPGAINGVLWPLILKSWGSLPTFMTLNTTVFAPVLVESVKLNSFALTVTVVVTCDRATASCTAVSARPSTAATASSVRIRSIKRSLLGRATSGSLVVT